MDKSKPILIKKNADDTNRKQSRIQDKEPIMER